MTDEVVRAQLLAAANDLAQSTTNLAGELRDLRRYARRSRKMIVALAFSVSINIVVSCGFGWLATEASNTSDQTQRALQLAKTAGCEARNETNQEILLFLEDLSPPVTANSPQRTSQQRALTEAQKIFAPQKCG